MSRVLTHCLGSLVLFTGFAGPPAVSAQTEQEMATSLPAAETIETVVVVGLVVIATWCFGQGHYGIGLSCAWMASLLDTVDGKLARVTARSSRLGHVLDHGIDAVYPPFWYLCWGAGLNGMEHLEPFGLNGWVSTAEQN